MIVFRVLAKAEVYESPAMMQDILRQRKKGDEARNMIQGENEPAGNGVDMPHPAENVLRGRGRRWHKYGQKTQSAGPQENTESEIRWSCSPRRS